MDRNGSNWRGTLNRGKEEDHERLVQELYKLRDTYGYEVNVVSMDKLTRAEQLQLAGRTTVSHGFTLPCATPY